LNPNARIGSVRELLGQGAARIFAKNSFVRALNEEIKFLGSKVVETLPRHKGLIGNSLGIYTSTQGTNGTRRNNGSLLSHALQGIEAIALRVVLRLHGHSILLCMHDGWVSDKRLDKDQLETAILSATGFPLKIEEKQLRKSCESVKAKIREDDSKNTDYFNADQWFKYLGLREVEWVILDHFRGLATCK